MKSNDPFSPDKPEANEQPSPRFMDEKASDEASETEANIALKPAGLDNPFWN
jgi:hypothetical protein